MNEKEKKEGFKCENHFRKSQWICQKEENTIKIELLFSVFCAILHENYHSVTTAKCFANGGEIIKHRFALNF